MENPSKKEEGNRSKIAQLLEDLQPGLVPCVDDDGELPTIAEVKIRRDVAVDGAALVAVGVTICWLDLDDLRLCKQKMGRRAGGDCGQ